MIIAFFDTGRFTCAADKSVCAITSSPSEASLDYASPATITMFLNTMDGNTSLHWLIRAIKITMGIVTPKSKSKMERILHLLPANVDEKLAQNAPTKRAWKVQKYQSI